MTGRAEAIRSGKVAGRRPDRRDYTPGYRAKAIEQNGGPECELCGADPREDGSVKTEAHHVDRERDNDNGDNLTMLCGECHRTEHDDEAMFGVLASLPAPALTALDAVAEDRGYNSRSEAVARLAASAAPSRPMARAAAEAAASYYSDPRHAERVADEKARRAQRSPGEW